MYLHIVDFKISVFVSGTPKINKPSPQGANRKADREQISLRRRCGGSKKSQDPNKSNFENDRL